MAELCQVPALGAIAKVAQEQFTQKGNMSLHKPGMLGNVGLILFKVFYFAHDLGEDIGDRLIVTAADTLEEGVTGLDIQFDGCYPRAVLSPVMLFLHK
jgi:hypothetical protein